MTPLIQHSVSRRWRSELFKGALLGAGIYFVFNVGLGTVACLVLLVKTVGGMQ